MAIHVIFSSWISTLYWDWRLNLHLPKKHNPCHLGTFNTSLWFSPILYSRQILHPWVTLSSNPKIIHFSIYLILTNFNPSHERHNSFLFHLNNSPIFKVLMRDIFLFPFRNSLSNITMALINYKSDHFLFLFSFIFISHFS